MRLAAVILDPRYRGPPRSGNGGYVAGLLATYAGGEVPEVRLLRPPPLGVPLEVVHGEEPEAVELRHGDVLVAVARPAPEPPASGAPPVLADAPAPPSAVDAALASQRYAGYRGHVFPGCFVCGTERAAGDGLRVHAGPCDDGGRVAAPWTPGPELAGTRGRVRPEFVWSVLDCPGYFALAGDGRLRLLGTLAVRLGRAPAVGEPCIVTGWPLGGEGRRRYAGTALHAADGEPLAIGVATWVEPRPGAGSPTGGSG